jgi:uridine kinase
MNCPSSVDLATHVVLRLRATPGSPDRPRVLGISGYPYTGKSHLARAVRAAWPSRDVTVLPTESAVLSRRQRWLRRTDGCSPEGHDMQGLLKSVTLLRDGHSTTCAEYSWASGHAGATARLLLPGVGADGLLIIDGTVAAAPPVLGECDIVVFLWPKEEAAWLPMACHRDVAQRAWKPASARLQNIRKYGTSSSLGKAVQRSLCLSVAVDPLSWTWFLPGCRGCDGLPGNLSSQATVSMAGCKAR